jgi:hypothetical protein|tara:strand:- start:2302 stop:4107 length:1806 start_codon:yes stop_codon:yes gene_type:complete
MPNHMMLPLKIPPGIVKDWTDYAAEGRWVAGDKVRFRNDLPEKLKGWVRSTITDDSTLTGITRVILAWYDLSEVDLLAFGTNSHIWLISAGTLYDITPLRATTTNMADPPFSMTSGSAVVTVTDTAHGSETGDYVTISQAAAAGGITIDGNYQLTRVDANSYTITHSSAATSTTTGGGAAADAEYAITTQNEDAVGTGWGAGGWGGSTWGTARTTGVPIELPVWSFDLWGEDLVATIRGGGTYVWDASAGTGTRAATASGVPSTAKLTRVSTADRHLVAYGAHDGSSDDPVLIRWSDDDDRTDFTATATNSAGTHRLTRGTSIITAIDSRNQTVVFTNTSVHAQSFVGPPFIYNFRLLADDTTLIGQNAVSEVDGTVFWMGSDDFYMYAGEVDILPCPLRRDVFDNLNRPHQQKCFSGINQRYQEVWFFYPRGTATEPSHYVAFYYGEPRKNIWHEGSLARTVWYDIEKFLENPIAVDSSGNLYEHENGDDDHVTAMSVAITSGAIQLTTPETGAGDRLLLMDKFIPDASTSDDMTLTVFTRKYPQDPETTKGPFTITSSTGKVSLRAKGRQLRIKYASSTLGQSWHIGTPRARVRVQGQR